MEGLIFLAYAVFYIPLIIYGIKALIIEEEVAPWKWKFGTALGLGTSTLFTIILVVGHMWTEYTWFGSMGFGLIYTKPLFVRWVLFLLFTSITFAFIRLNGWAAKKLTPQLPEDYSPRGSYENWENRSVGASIAEWVITFLASVGMGFWAASEWELLLMKANQVATSVKDPIFGKSLGFYFFDLPVYRFLSDWLMVLLPITAFGLFLIYAFYYSRTDSVMKSGEEDRVFRIGFNHILLVVVAFIGLIMWKCKLAIYGLMFSPRGEVFGAGRTDIHVNKPAFNIIFWLLFLTIIFLLSLMSEKVFEKIKTKHYIIIGSAWVVVFLAVLVAWPALYQKVYVEGAEIKKESQYITHNINYTRQAYGLDSIELKNIENVTALTKADIEKSKDIIPNICLWDWRALGDTLKNLQEIRQYYEFDDVEIDRYMIDGKYRQVMLALREISTEQLPNKTWVNTHLMYTHGNGLCLGIVSQFTGEGLPKLSVRDIPPVSSVPEIKITRPEIYFGEWETDHIFVNAKGVDEFNYPANKDETGKENEYSRYQGRSGVKIGTGLRKLLLAVRFDGLMQMNSEYLTPESKIIFRRGIREIVNTIAPFLKLDEDPYPFVRKNGSIFWLLDGFTTSKMYPYSMPHSDDEFNYIRNSVKITIDAYNGDITFYVFDDKDPLIRTWMKIFPTLFRPKSDMPEDILAHVRYPEDLFLYQVQMYSRYHMTDPTIFYNNEDLWQIPMEKYNEEAQPVDPYHVIINLPDEKQEEFMLIVPLTPKGRPNLSSWMAVKCDNNYGKIVAFQYPKSQQIDGTMQFEYRIDNNTELASLFSLWTRSGSKIIRAHTLIIPVGNSILYVKPVYLKATESGGNKSIPEMKLVILSSGTGHEEGKKMAWGSTFELALENLFKDGQQTKPISGYAIESTSSPASNTQREVFRAAQQHFENYLLLTANGKLAEAGAELQKLQAALNDTNKK